MAGAMAAATAAINGNCQMSRFVFLHIPTFFAAERDHCKISS
jgi:hypothetical protein